MVVQKIGRATQQSTVKPMKKALFVTYGGGHAKMVLPVVQQFLRDGRLQVQVLALTTARTLFARHGIATLGFHDFVTAADSQALAWGNELCAGTANHPEVAPQESVAYLGLSFADLVADVGLEMARSRYAALGRAAFCPVHRLSKIIAQLRPDVVIATNTRRSEMAAILAARQLAVAAVCLVDWFPVGDAQVLGTPGYADRVCVPNQASLVRLVQEGRPAQDISVTGNPAFDSLATPGLQNEAQKWLSNQPWQACKKILWASQPEPVAHRITGAPGNPALPEQIFGWLRDMLSRHPDWHLIARPHPSENASFMQAGPQCSVSLQTEPLHLLLASIDAVVCMTSTVGYEAALLGKPLVHIPLSVHGDEADYTQMGLALKATDPAQIEQALTAIFDQAWSPPHQLPAPGGATSCVCQVIVDVAYCASNSAA